MEEIGFTYAILVVNYVVCYIVLMGMWAIWSPNGGLSCLLVVTGARTSIEFSGFSSVPLSNSKLNYLFPRYCTVKICWLLMEGDLAKYPDKKSALETILAKHDIFWRVQEATRHPFWDVNFKFCRAPSTLLFNSILDVVPLILTSEFSDL